MIAYSNRLCTYFQSFLCSLVLAPLFGSINCPTRVLFCFFFTLNYCSFLRALRKSSDFKVALNLLVCFFKVFNKCSIPS